MRFADLGCRTIGFAVGESELVCTTSELTVKKSETEVRRRELMGTFREFAVHSGDSVVVGAWSRAPSHAGRNQLGPLDVLPRPKSPNTIPANRPNTLAANRSASAAYRTESATSDAETTLAPASSSAKA